jgi:hypothetical protein
MSTLVIDTGMSIIGIFDVSCGIYTPYMRTDFGRAIKLIEEAEEIVTYSGKHRDLNDLAHFNGGAPLTLRGTHTDMRSVCWSDRIWGSDLPTTYLKHFNSRPDFPDTYEGNNERDVYI